MYKIATLFFLVSGINTSSLVQAQYSLKVSIGQPFIKEFFYSVAPKVTSSNNDDTTYILVGDTLFSNQHYKIAVGQPIIIGKASDEQDWYKTIAFRSGASWPLVFLKKLETNQNIEYQIDPSTREKDKVKEYLNSGDTLIVTKIKRLGSKRFGNYWYQITMGQKLGLMSLNFKCDIINAIRFGEVILPSE